MLRTAWSLFLTGLFLGSGPCLLSCGPLLLSYIAGTKESSFSGLKTYLIFSATRLLAYALLGYIIGLLGEVVFHRIFDEKTLGFLYRVFGLFVLLIGLLLVFEKLPWAKACQGFWQRCLGPADIKNIVVFGLVVSLSPCLPLLSVLSFIALISDHWLKGVVFMAAFGLGTAISPMILLSMGAGSVARLCAKNELFLRALKIICGVVIVSLGLLLLLR